MNPYANITALVNLGVDIPEVYTPPSGTWTVVGDIATYKDGLANTTTDAAIGTLVANRTAATAGVQQYSPILALEGQGWGSTAGESQEVQYGLQIHAYTSGVAGGVLYFKTNFNDAGWTPVASLSSGVFSCSRTLMGDGSASAPAYSFSVDSDVGIYRIGDNSFGFAVNGALAAYFASTGQLIINDTDGLLARDDRPIFYGDSSDVRTEFNNADLTVPSFVVGLPAASRYYLIVEEPDIASGYDFLSGAVAATNPTLRIHSSAQSTTQWVSFAHDQTDAVIDWGTGELDFAGGTATASTVTHDEYWQVQIGGVVKKIMLGS